MLTTQRRKVVPTFQPGVFTDGEKLYLGLDNVLRSQVQYDEEEDSFYVEFTIRTKEQPE